MNLVSRPRRARSIDIERHVDDDRVSRRRLIDRYRRLDKRTNMNPSMTR
jgi:hypothetical protein